MRPIARLAELVAGIGSRCVAGPARLAFESYCQAAQAVSATPLDPRLMAEQELGRAIIGTACVQRWLQNDAAAAKLAEQVAAADPALSAVWEQADRTLRDDTSLPHLADALLQAFAKRLTPGQSPSPIVAAAAGIYEHLLAAQDRPLRKRRGVFYTPWPLASFVVRSIDERLRGDCGVSDGFLDPAVRVLDPGSGSGIFLACVVKQAGAAQRDAISDLLVRMRGVELLPGAWVMAHWMFALTLAEIGFRAAGPLSLPLERGDMLASPPTSNDRPPTVVLGNPPFAGNSASGGKWIEDLLHGRAPGGETVSDYYSVAGEPLAERKHWLHDDYVKFIRFAHWQIERAGWGIVGLVTNHGYLDNVSFRGLRHALTATFPRIDLVDLHGNAKRRERTPTGGPDRNLFGVEQGVAVGIFCHPPSSVSTMPAIRHGDLWGDPAAKLAAFAEQTAASLATSELTPAAPHWRFAPHEAIPPPEWLAAWRLPDAMPVSSTAVVTARDALVIAPTREELLERMALLRDPALSDETIRARWLTRQRSPRHKAGSTRGWDLASAREVIRADERWQEHIARVAYRPFDHRYLYYSPAMVDWPRSDVMRHLLPGDVPNLALVARRQSPAGEPACYFWIADGLVVDGLIRSDNCGSESVFPLFLRRADGTSEPNFAPAFLAHVAAALPSIAVTPHDLAAYAYALFFSPEYRRRYAPFLRSDFPRIILPTRPELFAPLVALGRELIACHLMAHDFTEGAAAEWHGPECTAVAAGYPRWSDDRLHLTAESWLAPVPEAVWQYRVGTHQVCRKWIRDRRQSPWASQERQALRAIVAALARTIDLELAIDGGFSTIAAR